MRRVIFRIMVFAVSFSWPAEWSTLTPAGIHGRPYRPWGGVAGDNDVQGGWQGYCTHTSILFGPWHRPFLALFEVNTLLQIIWSFLTQYSNCSTA